MIEEVKLEYGTVGAFIVKDIFNLEDKCKPEDVHSFEGRVNTTENSISFIGDRFTCLKKLRLNNSIIPNVRDIGSRFVNLRFLSLARCGISSLNGIATISKALEELYLAFNNIDDCSELVGMDSLIVIDLEENKISDLTNIEFLSTCSHLKSLTLSGNPCVDDPEEYRTKVKGLLPNLLYLDEKRLKPKTPKSGVVGPSPRTTRIRNEISYKAPRRGRKDISDSNAGEEKQASEHVSEPVDEKDKESIKEPVKQIRPPEQAKQKRVKIRTPEPANVVQSHNSTKSNSSVPIRPPNEIKIKEPEYDGDDEVIITEMLDDIIEDRPPTSRGNYESKFFKDSFELPAKNKSSKGFKNKPHVITPRVPRGNKPVRPVSAANKM